MKKIILLSVSVLALMISSCGNSSTDSSTNKNDSTATTQIFNLDTTKLKTGDVFYQCDMHPQYISDKPGVCPKCEMDLTEIKKK